ncbi:uncharacterized protein LOC121594354 [Anopheles merus]|uniref:uncharacterized protein LOC121594354 n=1 Tax=Anopheles merus TaxID=30066 RepID=UPI001BE3E7B3|nr:uncharacterized protein LOC121594354 [Anopheles merus]
MQKESEMKQNKFTLISLNARFPGITIKSSSQTPRSSSPRNENQNPPLLCKTEGIHQPTPTDKDSLKLLSSTAPIMLPGSCKTETPRNGGSICYDVRESEKNKTNVANESYKQVTHCQMMTSKQSQGYSDAELFRIVAAKQSCGTRKKCFTNDAPQLSRPIHTNKSTYNLLPSVGNGSTQSPSCDFGITKRKPLMFTEARSSNFETNVIKDLSMLKTSVAGVWTELEYLTDHRCKFADMNKNTHEMEENISFIMPRITNESQLIEFNEQLLDDNYFQIVRNYFATTSQTGNKDAKSRMHDAFIALFDKQFVVQCSWRGGGKEGPKIPIDKYTNLWKLFKIIGENGRYTVEKQDVELYLKKKLRNAKSSLENYKGAIRSSSKIYHKRENKK